MFLNLLCSYGLDGLWSGATSISDGIFVVAAADGDCGGGGGEGVGCIKGRFDLSGE